MYTWLAAAKQIYDGPLLQVAVNNKEFLNLRGRIRQYVASKRWAKFKSE
jgi:hypothetical protein